MTGNISFLLSRRFSTAMPVIFRSFMAQSTAIILTHIHLANDTKCPRRDPLYRPRWYITSTIFSGEDHIKIYTGIFGKLRARDKPLTKNLYVPIFNFQHTQKISGDNSEKPCINFIIPNIIWNNALPALTQDNIKLVEISSGIISILININSYTIISVKKTDNAIYNIKTQYLSIVITYSDGNLKQYYIGCHFFFFILQRSV